MKILVFGSPLEQNPVVVQDQRRCIVEGWTTRLSFVVSGPDPFLFLLVVQTVTPNVRRVEIPYDGCI